MRPRTLALACLLALAGLAPTAYADPVSDCLAEDRLVDARGSGAKGCVAVAQDGDADGVLVGVSLLGRAHGDVLAVAVTGSATGGVAAVSVHGSADAPVAVDRGTVSWVPSPFCDLGLPFVPCFHDH